MSEDIVSTLSCNRVINHIWPDPCSIVSYFMEVLQHSLDRHAPYVTRTMSSRSAPWITADIKKLCKERDVLYKRARRLCSAELLTQYRTKRRELKELMLSSRQAHLRNKLASASDRAHTWRILRKEGLTVNKNNLNCNSFTVNELNSFYSTVKCAQTPCLSSSLDAIVAPIQDIDDSALSFHEITPDKVYETARMLSNKSKGQSPDGLPWKHLESLLLPLLPFLFKIFNCSISSNTYPDLWKRAFIIPLNKCNNPQCQIPDLSQTCLI